MTRPKTVALEPGEPRVRYEANGLRVELEPDHVVLIPVAPSAEREKQALLRRLAERPRLAAALAEHGAGGIAKQLPAERAPWPLGEGEGAGEAGGGSFKKLRAPQKERELVWRLFLGKKKKTKRVTRYTALDFNILFG
ncbi:hypothetical protein GNP92_19705 [Paenibacillus timonensis]|nr:hypothetical protein [Paenibacillus timonensis]MUG88575.1 hypothetical protein [Paenibacillus timonensis]